MLTDDSSPLCTSSLPHTHPFPLPLSNALSPDLYEHLILEVGVDGIRRRIRHTALPSFRPLLPLALALGLSGFALAVAGGGGGAHLGGAGTQQQQRLDLRQTLLEHT